MGRKEVSASPPSQAQKWLLQRLALSLPVSAEPRCDQIIIITMAVLLFCFALFVRSFGVGVGNYSPRSVSAWLDWRRRRRRHYYWLALLTKLSVFGARKCIIPLGEGEGCTSQTQTHKLHPREKKTGGGRGAAVSAPAGPAKKPTTTSSSSVVFPTHYSTLRETN